MDEQNRKRYFDMRKSIAIIFMFCATKIFAQNIYTIEQAVAEALRNNSGIQAVRWEEKTQHQLKKTSFDLPKTNVSLMYGQYNGFPNDNNFTVTQNIPLTAFGSQRALNNSLSAAAELKRASSENELMYQVKQVYYHLAYAKSFQGLLLQQDSIFEGFLKAASARYRTGETNLLEKVTAETQRNDMKNRLNQSRASIEQLRLQLQVLINSKELPGISINELTPLSWENATDTSAWSANPTLALSRQQIEVATKSKKFEATKLAPELMLGYFNQTLTGSINPENGNVANSSNRFSGIQVGLALPIFFGAQQARVKAAGYNQNASQSMYQQQRNVIASQWQQALQEYQKNKASLQYYLESALLNADLILKQSSAALKQGEIGYAEYLLGVRNAITIKEGHLQTLNAFNQSILYLEFLSAKQ
jgi:heavy metal efflux system protein